MRTTSRAPTASVGPLPWKSRYVRTPDRKGDVGGLNVGAEHAGVFGSRPGGRHAREEPLLGGGDDRRPWDPGPLHFGEAPVASEYAQVSSMSEPNRPVMPR